MIQQVARSGRPTGRGLFFILFYSYWMEAVQHDVKGPYVQNKKGKKQHFHHLCSKSFSLGLVPVLV